MSIITEKCSFSGSSREREPSYDALSRLNVGRFRWNMLICHRSSSIGELDAFLFFFHTFYGAGVDHDANTNDFFRSFDKHVNDR